MRVGIVCLMHESNTFIATPTTMADFADDTLADGPAIREQMAASHHEVGGFFAGLDRAGIEAVPVFAARALPHGPIAADTAAVLLDRVLSGLRDAGDLDGILAAPHGAAVAENEPDFDGHWLNAVREFIGPDVPLIATIDPHANVSPRMVAACDAVIAYRTNPHLDQHDRGDEAATLMARMLRNEVRPTMAAAFPPFAVNITQQGTSEYPMRTVCEEADRIRGLPGVLSVSPVMGFPYADVPEMGAAVIVVTDGDRSVTVQHAAGLAGFWWDRRREFDAPPPPPADVVAQAGRLDGPVCILDTGDNVGGGSPADGTVLAHEFVRQQVGPAFVCLYDPEAQTAAREAGVGTTVRLTAGGKSDGRHGDPIEGEFVVRQLTDGRFTERETRHGGRSEYDQGPTAVVQSIDNGLTLMLTALRMAPFSLAQITHAGVDPAAFRVLVAKGVHAPAAAYAPVCRHLLRAATPGATAPTLRSEDFRHRRRPMFPFEPETHWTANAEAES